VVICAFSIYRGAASARQKKALLPACRNQKVALNVYTAPYASMEMFGEMKMARYSRNAERLEVPGEYGGRDSVRGR